MSLNLNKGARPDEVFALTLNPTKMTAWGFDWMVRRVAWKTAAGSTYFTSWIVAWVIRWYHGSMKIDGSRTLRYWNGDLDDGRTPYQPVKDYYVTTTTPKERLSFRFSLSTPNRERWDNQGGI